MSGQCQWLIAQYVGGFACCVKDADHDGIHTPDESVQRLIVPGARWESAEISVVREALGSLDE